MPLGFAAALGGVLGRAPEAAESLDMLGFLVVLVLVFLGPLVLLLATACRDSGRLSACETSPSLLLPAAWPLVLLVVPCRKAGGSCGPPWAIEWDCDCDCGLALRRVALDVAA